MKNTIQKLLILSLMLGAASLEIAAQTCAPAPVNLISWWNADGSALDSRSRNNGALTGTTFVAGENGQAIRFAAPLNTDNFSADGAGALDITGNQVTLEAWIKLENNSLQPAQAFTATIGKTTFPNDQTYNLVFEGGATVVSGNLPANQWIMEYILTDSNGTRTHNQSTNVIVTADGNYHHFALTYDGAGSPSNNVKLYVDGVLQTTNIPFGNFFSGNLKSSPAEPFRISTGGSGSPFSADEVSVYNRALSAPEIQAIANAGTAGKCKPTAVVAPSGLVGWWAGDGNANDIAGMNNGTLQNIAGFAIGKVGQAFKFNGANAVTVSDHPSLNFGAGADLSIDAWVQAADSPDIRIIADKRLVGGGTVFGYAVYLRDNGIGLQLADGINSNYEVFGLNVRDGNFHHIAATVDRDSPTGGKLYLDGTIVLTFNPTDRPGDTSNSQPLRIGQHAMLPSFNFNGQIDELEIYNRALTGAEVTSIFNAGLAGKLKTAVTPTGFSVLPQPSAGNLISLIQNIKPTENIWSDVVISTNNFQPNANADDSKSAPEAVSIIVGDATVTFPNVATIGTTQVIPLDKNLFPALSSGVHTGLIYDAATSAAFTGNPTVCFNLPAFTPAQFAGLQIVHLENNLWTNRTAAANAFPTLCTTGLTSLSPLAIVAGSAPAALSITPSAANVPTGGTVNFTAAGGVAPYAFSILTNNSGAAINPTTGVYTAGTTAGAVDTVRVTDANNATANASVTVAAACVANQKTWDGGGAGGNWSEALNWTCDAVPVLNDTAIFNGASSKNVTVDVNVPGVGFQINNSYTGTISQGASNITISFGGSGFNQSGGTFNGGSGVIDCDGIFNLTGGTFNGGSATLFTQNTFTITAGAAFNPGTGKVVFDGSGGLVNVDSAAVLNSVAFNDVQINRGGFSVNLQTNDTLVANGTVELTTGGLQGGTVEVRGNVTVAPTFTQGSSSTGGILAITGTAARTITLPAGVIMPGITLNAPNTLVNTSGAGTVEFKEKLRLQAGTITAGGVNFNLGNLGYVQTGGTFTNGGGTLSMTNNSTGFALGGGIFNGGSGTVDCDNAFVLTGGIFNGGTSNIQTSGAFNVTAAAAFNPGAGKVVFDGSGTTVNVDSAAIPDALVFNNVKIDRGGFAVELPATDKLIVAGTLELTTGGIATGTVEALGDVTVGNVFNAGVNGKLRFAGNADQIFSNPGNTPFSSFASVTIDKGASNTVTANGSLILSVGSFPATLNITSGTLYLNNNSNLTTGALNVAVNGKLVSESATTITLGGNVVNSGTIDLQGGGANCPENDTITIRSSSAAQRSWTGGGRFRLIDVDVQNMSGTGTKTVFSGTSSGGNNASWVFDNNCPTALVVTPSSANVQTGAAQTFTAAGGFPGYTFSITTNNSGATINAATGIYTAGTTGGTIDTVRVTDSFGATGEATVNVFGAANRLGFVVQPISTIAGQIITPVIQVAVQDQFGSTITNSSAAVTMTIQTNPNGGTLAGTVVRNAVGGIAAFNNLSINSLGTGYTLRAASGSLIVATSNAFDITTGAASRLAFVVQPSDTTANAAITPAVQVAIQDASGNTITTATNAVTIAVGSNPNGGTLSGTLTQNAANGIAVFNNLNINNAGGGYTLTAASGSLTAATSNAFNIFGSFVVTNTNDTGTGSLRSAILISNSTAGMQTISFNIPAPPFNIRPATILPATTDAIIIDGTTQPGFSGSPIVEIDGTNLAGTQPIGLRINGGNSTVRGLSVINIKTPASGFGLGIFINTNSNGNTIQGNFIGINAAGAAAGNDHGIYIGGQNNLVGGAAAAERNVISANLRGIAIVNADNTVRGNFIGLDAGGTNPLGNSAEGVFISNLVSKRNRLSANRIYANGFLGIKLTTGTSTGVGGTALPNDSQDPDTGANERQNYPVLTSAISSGGNTTVTGVLNSTPSSTFALEFFSSPSCDASGYGEGETYLGAGNATTDAGGITGFTASLPVATASGRFITATATDANGNTSEFSQCRITNPVYSVSGRITRGSEPIKQVTVSLTGGSKPSSTLTNSNGEYRFGNVPAGGNYTVTPARAGFVFTPANKTFNNLGADQINQNFAAARPNFTVSGQIQSTFAGTTAALGGVTVTLSNGSTRQTDLNGSYTFNNVAAGNYTLTATKANFAFTPPSYNFTPLGSNQTADFTAQTNPPLTGRVAYFDSTGLGIMNADGSAAVRLFNNSGNSSSGLISASSPSISPDGSKIAFTKFVSITSGSVTEQRSRVSIMNFDGTVITPVGLPDTNEFFPSWSPDGTRIAFVRMINSSRFIKVINLATSSETSIASAANGGTRFYSLSWSPDGTKIAYEKNSASSSPTSEVRVVNSDGSGNDSLLNLSAGRPSWSPDGTKIAFIKYPSNSQGTSGRIALMNPDGTNVNTITNDPNPHFFALDWSPDGAYLAYNHFPIDSIPSYGVISAVGLVNIGIGNGFGSFPDWGAAFSPATLTGGNVNIIAGATGVTFSTVSGAGQTTVIPIPPNSAGAIPGGFVVGAFGAYEINTTANVTPPITVCFTVPSAVPQAQFNQIFILHNEGGILVPKTTIRDFPNRRVCASVDSLSPFVIAEQINAALPDITGLVQDAKGNPLGDVEIRLTGAENRTTISSSDGLFTFPNLTTGANYNVQPKQVGYLFEDYSRDFVNLSGENSVVFTGAAGVFQISGRVADGSGNGIGGANVALDGATQAEAITNAAGDYVFANLPADGVYTLTASSGGNSFAPPQISVDALTSDVAGADFVQFAPTAAPVVIGGRVKTAAGRGIANARLKLVDQNGAVRYAQTNPFGYYRFEDVSAGEVCVVTVSHKRYRFINPTRVISVVEEIGDLDFIALSPF